MKTCTILLLFAIAFGQENAYDSIVPEGANDAAVMVWDDLPNPSAMTGPSTAPKSANAPDGLFAPPKLANAPDPNIPLDIQKVKSTAAVVNGIHTATMRAAAGRLKEAQQLNAKGSPERIKSVTPGWTPVQKKQLAASITSTAASLTGRRQQAYAQSGTFKKHAQEIRSKLGQSRTPTISIPSGSSLQSVGGPIAPSTISGVRRTASDIQAIKKRLAMAPQHSVSHSHSDERAAKRRRRREAAKRRREAAKRRRREAARKRKKRRRKSDERAEKRARKNDKKKAHKEKAAKKRLGKKVKKEKKKARKKVAEERKKVAERDHKKVKKAKKKAERRFKEKCAKERKKSA